MPLVFSALKLQQKLCMLIGLGISVGPRCPTCERYGVAPTTGHLGDPVGDSLNHLGDSVAVPLLGRQAQPAAVSLPECVQVPVD